MGKPTLSLAFVLLLASPLYAQETPTEETKPEGEEAAPAEGAPAEGAPAEPAEPTEEDAALKKKSVRWGVGARVRYVFMPTSVLNLFVEQSQPMSSVGFGLSAVRRKDDFDVIFGFEYENIAADEGFWTESGGSPANGDTDYVSFDGFGLLGFDVGFVWHKQIAERVDFRYGAGIGLGFLLGDYIQTDAVCMPGTTVNMVNNTTCPGRGSVAVNDSKPPVVPIVNAMLGARIKATDEISINVEAGFRDVFFVGIGTDYIFP